MLNGINLRLIGGALTEQARHWKAYQASECHTWLCMIVFKCGNSEAGVVQTDVHPLFQRMSDEELAADPAACLLDKATEEGQKVARNSGLVGPCHRNQMSNA